MYRKDESINHHYFFPEGKNSGFTLLEVMVAVSLLAVAVVPLLVTHASTIRDFTRSREVTRSGLIAESRMALTEAQLFPEPFSELGEVEGRPVFYWDEQVSEVDPELMLKAEVMVSISEDNKGEKISLASYIANLEFEEEEEEEEEGETEE